MKLTIDYSRHPAFSQLTPAGPRRLAAAREYFDTLDDLWQTLLRGRDPVAAAGKFDLAHAALLLQLEAALATQLSAEYLPFVAKALAAAAQAIRREIVQRLSARNLQASGESAVNATRQKLIDHGAAGFQMATGQLQRVVAALKPFKQQLLEQRRTNDGARCFVVPPSKGEHWQIMKAFLREQRIEAAISAYAGYPLKLGGYAFTYSHPDETWYRNCYLDVGLAAPATVQMHYDEDNLSAKSMFYLNDVGDDNGPFSYLADARADIASRSQLAFFKYLDFANNEFAASQSAPETTYNRPLFITPALRAHFARLPAELQGTSGPGDDVLDGSSLSQYLQEKERRLVGPAGYLALFAGGETLHRGGVIKQGERWALQMIYAAPPSVAQRISRRLGSLTTAVPRLLSRARDRLRA